MLCSYIVDAILIKWCTEAGVDFHKVMYKISHIIPKEVGDKLYIYTSTPGWLIGLKGSLFDKYKAELEKEARGKVVIEFVETNRIMTVEEWNDYFMSRGF